MTILTIIAAIVVFGAGYYVCRRYGVYLDGIWARLVAREGK